MSVKNKKPNSKQDRKNQNIASDSNVSEVKNFVDSNSVQTTLSESAVLVPIGDKVMIVTVSISTSLIVFDKKTSVRDKKNS